MHFDSLLIILNYSAPLLLISVGALFTEYAGALGIFSEGVVNLSAFLCYAIAALSGSRLAGICVGILIPTIIVFCAALFMERSRANQYLVALAINSFSAGIIPILSYAFFGTEGALRGYDFSSLPADSFFGGAIDVFALLAFIIAIFIDLFFRRTVPGLVFKLSGNFDDFLFLQGRRPALYRICSWAISASCAAFAGCILTIRLRAFVPGISAGRGWISLAIIFLGMRSVGGIAAAAILFSALEYITNILQGYAYIPGALLLAAPYAAALAVLIIVSYIRRFLKRRLVNKQISDSCN